MNLKEDILSSFQSISLEQMDSVKLLNRVDTKFIFNLNRLPEVLSDLEDQYYILETDGQRLYPYLTTYFDTDQFSAYVNHHNGKLNRHKVRIRTYVTSNQHYFEIKFKDNKKRTIKTRIRVPDNEPVISGEKEKLLLKHSPYTANELSPKLTVKFSRMTLVNKKMNERITLDTNLTFILDHVEKSYDGLMIAEVKQGKTEVSPFIRRLHRLHVNPARLSKYCIGVISMYDGIKYNQFKETLLNINKLVS